MIESKSREELKEIVKGILCMNCEDNGLCGIHCIDMVLNEDAIKKAEEKIRQIEQWHRKHLNQKLDDIIKWVKIVHNSNWRKKSMLMKKINEMKEQETTNPGLTNGKSAGFIVSIDKTRIRY